MGRVVVLGSLNVDLVTDVERHPRPGETVLATGPVRRFAGGKGGNQAVAAVEAGARVAMVGAVGEDEDGARYLARLRSRGVDVSAVRVEPGAATGQAWITVDADSENAIVVIPGANADLTLEDLEPVSDLGPGDVLLVQLEVPMAVVAAAARRAHGRGARASEPDRQIALPLADVVRDQVHEQVRDALNKLRRLREGANVARHRGVPSGKFRELRYVIGIGQEADVKHEVAIGRDAIPVAEARNVDKNFRLVPLSLKLLGDYIPQLVNVEL
jgi:hypothetical protein